MGSSRENRSSSWNSFSFHTPPTPISSTESSRNHPSGANEIIQTAANNMVQSSPLSIPLNNHPFPSAPPQLMLCNPYVLPPYASSIPNLDVPGIPGLASPPAPNSTSSTLPPSSNSASIVEALADSSILPSLLHVFSDDVLEQALALLREKRIAAKKDNAHSMAQAKSQAVARLWTVEQYNDHIRKLEERVKIHRENLDALNQREVELELVLQLSRAAAAKREEHRAAGSVKVILSVLRKNTTAALHIKTRKQKRPTKRSRPPSSSSSISIPSSGTQEQQHMLKNRTPPHASPAALVPSGTMISVGIVEPTRLMQLKKEFILRIPDDEQATLFDELSGFFNPVQGVEKKHAG
ncbi:hypothetical protein PRIPAC_70226 [Pristionchus pacificus]|uniref:Uncharacterized protein n=1 Tax=Pristionchus pacificus TaxID=54126 RepID=A0A2A6C044_PRIPA|nr:hypothetical protein PRIPAC_70226 [Pristionchus pacificus]|eukprot:PDM71383.1 hypothetical protein PRIPAC_37790 [Pristionchus pacificus]